MTIVGIICEYNPFHLGHEKQLRMVRETFGDDCGIICLMSGAFVQRGEPAIFEPSLRAQAAVLSGADLVLELPATSALSSAEGFAAGGIRILSQFCDYLSFGTETLDTNQLNQVAETLLTPVYSAHLKDALSTGCSFPAARQKALESIGQFLPTLSNPNDILAVEYCKAIKIQNSPMRIAPITRKGDYHSLVPDSGNPSATAIRNLIKKGAPWHDYTPERARSCFAGANVHTLEAGERVILSKLRTMTDSEFENLPFGSEGLWRKLMHASRTKATLDEIITAMKSKRYTRTRLNRMIMCALLGITNADMASTVPYTRILAFNDRGRKILNNFKDSAFLLNAGAASEYPFQQLETRCLDLYGLFASGKPDAPGIASRQRVFYYREDQAEK